MDIVTLLGTLKGKALDLRDIELLKHAYELQEENIKQLKTSNDIYRDQTETLKARLAEREDQIGELREQQERLQMQLADADTQLPVAIETLNTESERILRLLAMAGDKVIYHDDIAVHLGKPIVAIKHWDL